MSGVLNGIVKLNQIQYEQLMKNKTITVNGVTVNYNQNTLYIVEAIKVTVEDNQDITGNKNFTGDLKKNNVDVATINDIPPVVDVLTSDSSTSSLSAKQGKVLDEKIQNMMSTLNGKNASFTFDTLDTLLNHFPGISKGDEPADKYLINTDKITYGGQEYTLKNGDIFLIVDINVPDYWFSIDDKTLYKLETAKVDLAEYAKITDLTMYAKTSDLAEYAKTSDVSKDYLKKEDIADWAKQANPPSNVVLVDNVYQEIDGMKVFLKGVESGNGVSTAASGFKDARRCADDNNNTHQLSLYVGSEGTARLAHKNRSVNANNVDSYIAFDSTKLKYGTSGNAGTAANNEYDIITSDYDAYKYAEEKYNESKNIFNLKKYKQGSSAQKVTILSDNSFTSSITNSQYGLVQVFLKDLVDYKANEDYTISCLYTGDSKTNPTIGIYAENNQYIKSTDSNKITFNTSNYAGLYIVFICSSSSYLTNTCTYSNIQLEKGKIPTEYYPYNQNRHITNSEAEYLEEKHYNYINLLDTSQNVNGKEFMNEFDVINNSSYCITGFIKVNPNTTYTVSGLNNTNTRFFDINGVYISKYVDSATFTTPSNCYYVRYNYPINTQYPMLNKGNVALPYQPFDASGYITDKEACLLKSESKKTLNLFDKNNFKYINAYPAAESGTLVSNSVNKTLYIPCEPNTTYAVSKITSAQFAAAYCVELPAPGVAVYNTTYPTHKHGRSYCVLTTGDNAKYIILRYVQTAQDPSSSGVTEQQILDSIQIEKGSLINDYQSYNGPIIHEKDLSKVATTGNYWDLSNLPTIPSAPTDYISYEKSQSLTSTQKNLAAKNMGIDKPWNLWWTNSNSSSLSGGSAFSAQDITLSFSMTSGQAYEIKVVYLVEPAGDDNGYASYQQQTFVFWGGSAKGRGRFNGTPQDDFSESTPSFRFYQRELKKGTAANVLSFTSCKRYGYAASNAVGESNWNCVPVYIYGREIDMSFKS